MKKIYLVRHGQTEMNKAEKVQGRVNSPLTALGQMQACFTGQFFSDQQIHFDKVFTSPAGRARETAMLLCPYKKAAVIDGLNETSFGSLEGTNFKEMGTMLSRYDFTSVGGENLEMVVSRIRQAFETILSQTQDGQTVLVVGHGSSGFRLAQSVDPVRAKKLRKFGNCMIYEYSASGDTLADVRLDSIELGPAALLDETRYND